MKAIDRLIEAEKIVFPDSIGILPQNIHHYNRVFGFGLGENHIDLSEYGPEDFAELARKLVKIGQRDLAVWASRASIAHLKFSK